MLGDLLIGIVHRALCIGTPSLFGLVVGAEHADHVDAFRVLKFDRSGIFHAAAHHEVEALRGGGFLYLVVRHVGDFLLDVKKPASNTARGLSGKASALHITYACDQCGK